MTNPAVRSLADEAAPDPLLASDPVTAGPLAAATVPAGPPMVRSIEPPSVAPLPNAAAYQAREAPTQEVLPTLRDLQASGTQIPEVTLVLRPPDASKTWDTIERVSRQLADEAGTTVTMRTEDGVEVRRIVTEQATVSYARLDDDRMIVTTGDAGIRTFLADDPKLVDSDAYERAAEAVDMGDRTSGFVYLDVDGMLPLIEQMGASVGPESKDAISSVDSFILQASGDGDVSTLSGFVRLSD